MNPSYFKVLVAILMTASMVSEASAAAPLGYTCSTSQLLFPLLYNSSAAVAKQANLYYNLVQNQSNAVMSNSHAALGAMQTLCNMVEVTYWVSCNPSATPSFVFPVDSTYVTGCGPAGANNIVATFKYFYSIVSGCTVTATNMGPTTPLSNAYNTCQLFNSNNCLSGPNFNGACLTGATGK